MNVVNKKEFDFILNNIKIQIYKNKNLQDKSVPLDEVNRELVKQMYNLITNNINFTTEQDRKLYLESLERNKNKLKMEEYLYFHSKLANNETSKKRSPSYSTEEEESPRKKYRTTLSKIDLKHKLRILELNILRGKWMNLPKEEIKKRLLEHYSCLEENISLIDEDEKKMYLTSLEKNKDKMKEEEYQRYKNLFIVVEDKPSRQEDINDIIKNLKAQLKSAKDENEIYKICKDNTRFITFIVSFIPWKYFNVSLIKKLVDDEIMDPNKKYEFKYNLSKVESETFISFVSDCISSLGYKRTDNNLSKLKDLRKYLNQFKPTIQIEEEGQYKGDMKDDVRHGYGKMIYKNNEVYEGEWKDDKRDGFGTLIYSNGTKYEGEWKGNLQDGEGKYTCPNGMVYCGQFKSGKKHGKGTLTHAAGDEYVGEWKYDKRNGKGKYTCINGDIYDGEWKDDKLAGYGLLICNDGRRYEGEWKNDKREGQGKDVSKKGDIYYGEWKNDNLDGYGVLIWKNGERYEGEWKNGKKNGKGKWTFKDGIVFEGNWKEDKKDGKGTMTWPTGYKYEGDWKEDKKDGKGAMTWPTGYYYEGEWKNDKKDGKGKLIHPDGSVYVGEFNLEIKKGQGQMTFSDGSIYNGEWKDDKRDGYGKMIYKNGKVYEGEWKDDKKDGKGIWTSKKGKVYHGEWKNNKYVEERSTFNIKEELIVTSEGKKEKEEETEEETEEEEYNEDIKCTYKTHQINNDIFYGKPETISILVEKAKDIRRDNIIPKGCSGGDIHNINRKSLIPYHIELSEYGNLIHFDTGFVVDFKGRFKVIGKENKDGKVTPLNEKDVEECKKHNLRYPFLYPIFFQQFISTPNDDWKTIYKLIQDYPSCYSRFMIMTKPIKKVQL